VTKVGIAETGIVTLTPGATRAGKESDSAITGKTSHHEAGQGALAEKTKTDVSAQALFFALLSQTAA
jgi:hypothetical protein